MDKIQTDLIKNKLKIELNAIQLELLKNYQKTFLEKNSMLNLISKNDEKFLFEKHIFDSLVFSLAFEKLKLKNDINLLDIGTGGGFPSVLLSILYPDMNIYALDSIRKKINAVEAIKSDLNLENLFPICERAEKLQKNNMPLFDIVTSRAVASMDLILRYAFMNLKLGGYFVAFKSKKYKDELNDAKRTMKKLNAKVVDIVEYKLPLEENYERYLLVIEKT